MTAATGPKIARRAAIAPFVAMDVLRAANARAAAGEAVVHLEVGQPSAPAPLAVREAAGRAIGSERLGYTDALGLETLRRRIARHYREQYGVGVDWQRVVITTGSSGAFLLAFLAAFDAGERVGVATPGYPAYRNILATLGVGVVPIRTAAETDFRLDAAAIEALPADLAGLIVASPANPTGAMLSAATLQGLVAQCVRRGIRLVSDEIYHGITYGTPAATALAFSDDVIVVNSFSKYYAMTGWRLGWMVLPEPLVRPIERLAQNFFISPPTLSQLAATAAFDCRAELDANVALYAHNREILLQALPAAGFAKLTPADGAFYLYADVGDRTGDSDAFCRKMLVETGVAATPGIDFDPLDGSRYVRFSFAGATEEIIEAARRLARWAG